MDSSRSWVFVIGVLLVMAITGFALVWVVQDTINNTVSPVQSITGDLGTRVSQVMNPTPTILPDPITIIREVRALARLETIQYSIEKVITAQTKQEPFGFLFGDKLIFVAHGEVIAGIDLEKITTDDIWVEKNVLYVRLPEPEIFVATLDNEHSYIYDRERGALTKGDINLETEARKAAELEIQKAAEEDNILQLAKQNAENFLYGFFRQLGFPEVIFENRDQLPEG